jgi:hypothetical protein
MVGDGYWRASNRADWVAGVTVVAETVRVFAQRNHLLWCPSTQPVVILSTANGEVLIFRTRYGAKGNCRNDF